MRRVVISDHGWIDAYPKAKRPDIMRMVFSLAAENGYDIVVSGQHWPK